MIERHVYFKLRDNFATDAGRAELVAETQRVIPSIPGVVDVTVGIPADAQSLASWDVFLTVRFASLADVEPYVIHPIHQKYVTDFLAPRVEVKKAWNLRITPR